MQEKKGVMGCTRSGGDTISVSINRKPSPNHRFGSRDYTGRIETLTWHQENKQGLRKGCVFFLFVFYGGEREGSERGSSGCISLCLNELGWMDRDGTGSNVTALVPGIQTPMIGCQSKPSRP